MKTLDRIVLAALALGVWVLAVGQFFVSNPVYSETGFDRRQLRLAITNCQVQGPISNSQINATIYCR